MTHVTRGLKTVKTAAPLVLHPPVLGFPVSLFHHYLMLSSIHVNPSLPSAVSMADCSNGGAEVARGSGILGLRHQARSGSDRSSCQSQDLCPCCQIRVLLGGQQIGRGVSFPECWCGRIKIGDVGKHNRERGHCGVESWIHFYESTIHFLTVQFSSLLM